uniref:Myb/SANT-like DNA-binding domain-containing protein n=1 Tax=Bracon brevicornis TaxID=1563983 RepID=A0A6V7JWZ3_9HYME
MKMSDTTESTKYKWTPESTTLLVSVWTDRQVQKQLEYAVKPQVIWESIAKYMRKKGYEVTAKQCRSRMKQVLVCYREAKKSGTRAGVERYYESIDKVLESKRLGKQEIEIETDIGIDTVDSAPLNLRSPEKDTKTQTNFMVRQNKFEEPPEPLLRQIDLDARYTYGHEYYDSSESNETVLARPHRSLSPTIRDPRLNLEPKILRPNVNKNMRRSHPDERYRYNTLSENIPLKNTVQNVQNQIIQENMMLRNQLSPDFMVNQIPQQIPDYYNIGHMQIPQRQSTIGNYVPDNLLYTQPQRMSTNMARIQSQLQQCALTERMDAKNFGPYSQNPELNGNFKPFRSQPNYAQDIAPNLNEAFTQQKMPKPQNLNETYDQDADIYPVNQTAITNNATFNDDTISIDFAQDSPSASENGASGSKNNESPPNIPLRKKKAQKLEQLMINALTSQTEVVNKILAAQDSMVSKILDRDQDRQNRLENRLDQLMNVVQATVLNKSTSSKDSEAPTVVPATSTLPSVPICFSPPPRPGLAPPKLDLVPPKPCRVPCTSPSSNIEFIQQNPMTTKPGVIRPQKPGTIWSKLGPVSASPFVQAQKEMNIAAIAQEWRTKSSAERRIAISPVDFNTKSIIEETSRFLQSERLMEERIENARRTFFDEGNKGLNQSARRSLFNPKLDEIQNQEEINKMVKTPSAAVILTQTFLEIERQAEEKTRMNPIPKPRPIRRREDDLLSGQGDGFERLRNLEEALGLNTSTPAKVEEKYEHKQRYNMNEPLPKQTIQELAHLVMQSARWKNPEVVEASSAPPPPPPPQKSAFEVYAQRQGYKKAKEWLEDRYSYGAEKQNVDSKNYSEQKNYPMGFINPGNYEEDKIIHERRDFRPIGFHNDVVGQNKYAKETEFLERERTYERQKNRQREQGEKEMRRAKDSDAEDNDEYLDTTTTMKPYRKTSLTSNGGGSGTGSLKNPGCAIS